MPIKTWAPYDRLTAADLNANFAAAIAHPQPGAAAAYNATPTNLSPIDTWIEVKPSPPTAGSDPLGYWNASTSRLVVPAGCGGIYLIGGWVNFSGGTAGNQRNVRVNPSTYAQAVPASQVGGANGHVIAIAWVPVGAPIYMECMTRVDTCTASATGLTAIRLATAYGSPSSLMRDLLESALEVGIEGVPFQELPPGEDAASVLAMLGEGGMPREGVPGEAPHEGGS